MSTRWVGDLKTCFLLQDGWAFRFEVTYFHLDDRGGWRFPLTYAEHVGLCESEERFLTLASGALEARTWIVRYGSQCSGGPIAEALHSLGADEGDLAFFWVRGNRYGISLRRRSELLSADPLTTLTSSCGLDPADARTKSDPWPLLSRALGGAGGGREEVRRRLAVRRDDKLAAIVDSLARGGATAPEQVGEPWPPGWPYRMPEAQAEPYFSLIGGDGTLRTAVGVLDGSNQPPRDLLLSEGNLLWRAHEAAADSGEISELLQRPPRGLAPAASRGAWVRLMRAEHVARRAALAGFDWTVSWQNGKWRAAEASYEALADALAAVGDSGSGVVAVPTARVRTPYPRSAVAVRHAFDDAIQAGLHTIGADPAGFRADYGGAIVTGASLHEIAIPRGR